MRHKKRILYQKTQTQRALPEAQVEITPLQKAPLISCARLLVTYAPPITRGGFLMAANQV